MCPRRVLWKGEWPHLQRPRQFEGFYFDTEDGHEHKLKGCTSELEKLVVRAWTSRWVVTVAAEQEDLECPITIVLNHPS
jgi:hypothetical protein